MVTTVKLMLLRSHDPLLQEEFSDWLAFHKRKWEWQRQQRKLRKKGKLLFPVATSTSRQASQQHSMGNLTGFLRRRANILVENPWQIIQVMIASYDIIITSYVLSLD